MTYEGRVYDMPDTYTTDAGVEIERDTTYEDHDCDVPGCTIGAERRFDAYYACGFHFEKVRRWAEDAAYEARAESMDAERREADHR